MSLIERYASFDIIETVGNYYQKIPTIWCRAFFIALVINCVVFASIIISPPMGNHDFDRVPWSQFSDQLGQGRWFGPIILSLYGHIQVPVVNLLTAIVLNVAAAMAAIVLWKRDKSVSSIVFLVCIVTLAPYILFQYYYRWMAPIFPASALMGILGMIVASRMSFKAIALASLLVMFSIAAYQPTVNVIATVFCVYAMFEILDAQWGFSSLTATITEKFLPKVIAIVLGSIGYGLSLAMLKFIGRVSNPYQLETLPPLEMFARFGLLLTAPIHSFVHSQAFMPSIVNISLLGLFLGSLITVGYTIVRTNEPNTTKICKTVVCITTLVLALIVSKVMFLVSAEEDIHNLKWGYGLAFFYMGCAAVLLSYSVPVVKSVALLFIAFLLLLFSREDLVYQELMTRSNQHDMAFANRLLFKVESLPGLDFEKSYKYLQIGDYPDFRRERYKTMGHEYDLEPGNQFFTSTSPLWEPTRIFPFLGAKLNMYTDRRKEHSYWDSVVTAINHAEDSQPWPHESSVVLKGDTIVVYLDRIALEELKEKNEAHLEASE